MSKNDYDGQEKALAFLIAMTSHYQCHRVNKGGLGDVDHQEAFL